MSERKRKATRAAQPALGPGIHAGYVELDAPPRFHVRTTDGTRVVATPAPHVERTLVEECLRERRAVLLANAAEGPVILGALQTACAPAVRDDTLSLVAGTIALRAGDALEIDVGEASMSMRANGIVEVRGDRLVVNVGALVRFLAARVELP